MMSSILWMMEKLKEGTNQARQEHHQRKSMVQKSTDFLRRIIAPLEGQGGVTLSFVCFHCHRRSQWGTVTVVRRRRSSVTGGELHAASTTGRTRTVSR